MLTSITKTPLTRSLIRSQSEEEEADSAKAEHQRRAMMAEAAAAADGAGAAAMTPAPAGIRATTDWNGTCQRRTTLFTSRDGYIHNPSVQIKGNLFCQ